MIDYLKLFFVICLGNLTAIYIHSIIFVIFKANKYEDSLAKKISKEIKNENKL